MRELEKYFFDNFKQCNEVSQEDCYIGGHNCGTCAHCHDHDTNFGNFENRYCTRARKERER